MDYFDVLNYDLKSSGFVRFDSLLTQIWSDWLGNEKNIIIFWIKLSQMKKMVVLMISLTKCLTNLRKIVFQPVQVSQTLLG